MKRTLNVSYSRGELNRSEQQTKLQRFSENPYKSRPQSSIWSKIRLKNAQPDVQVSMCRPSTNAKNLLLKRTSATTINMRKTLSVSMQSFTSAVMIDSASKLNIEDYSFTKIIGQGSYAVVREAVHKSSGEKCAIKTYEKLKLQEKNRRKFLNNEVKVLQQLDHPGIIKLEGVIETPKRVHLVLELVPGQSLLTYVRSQKHKKLEEEEAKIIFKQITSAVHHCHTQKITHRDIKLDNVLIDQFQNVKLIDFGFSTPDSRKTRMFCGTPNYMAPEIMARKESSGENTDVWALGVLLYVMLNGIYPFSATSDRELCKKIQKGAFKFEVELSPAAKQLINSMLEPDPTKRATTTQILESRWFAKEIIVVIYK